MKNWVRKSIYNLFWFLIMWFAEAIYNFFNILWDWFYWIYHTVLPYNTMILMVLTKNACSKIFLQSRWFQQYMTLMGGDTYMIPNLDTKTRHQKLFDNNFDKNRQFLNFNCIFFWSKHFDQVIVIHGWKAVNQRNVLVPRISILSYKIIDLWLLSSKWTFSGI